MAPIIVGYWRQRAIGQPIRLLLAYKKVEFVDKFYKVGDPPFYDKSSFHNEKHKLGLDFPNLPYIIDGDVKLSQSNAIMRYLARKYDLMGESEEQHRRVDLLENQIVDLRIEFWNLTYYSRAQDFGKNLEKYKEDSQYILDLIDKFLGPDRKFVAGDKITYVDFLIYEALDQIRLLSSDILMKFDNINNYLKRFKEIPEIKEFLNSDRYFEHPVNNKYAVWK